MSFFPQAFLSSHPASLQNQSSTGFTPLFRLLEDFDNYSRTSPSEQNGHLRQSLKTFTPKFDVKEEEGLYELHGELPGIEQKDVEIEFTDAQTISVRGKTEREYTTTTAPELEGAQRSGAIEEAPKDKDKDSTASHQPTVADENEDGANKSVEKADQQPQQKKPSAKYWASERTFGSFARTFTFPERIDQDAVRASMKNGVLTVVVPKAPKYQSKRIAVE